MGKIKDFINQKSLLGEITRFVLVGGLSTVIDFLTMGIVLYIAAPDNYDSFLNVFFGVNEDPTSFAALFGTGLGFVIGVFVNYALSIFFVFNENGDVRSVKGFFLFAALATGGLVLHEVGMWALHIKFNVNEWLVKAVMTFVVMVYNFITRKLILFNDKPDRKEIEREEKSR